MQQALLVLLDGCRLIQENQCVAIAGVTGIQDSSFSVQKNDGPFCVSGDGDSFKLYAAKIKDIAFAKCKSDDRAWRCDVVNPGCEGRSAGKAAGRGVTIPHFHAGVLIQQRDIGGIDIYGAVLEIRADMIDMTVRIDECYREIRELPDICPQASDTGKRIDEERFFLFFYQVSLFAAETGDQSYVVIYSPFSKKFGLYHGLYPSIKYRIDRIWHNYCTRKGHIIEA